MTALRTLHFDIAQPGDILRAAANVRMLADRRGAQRAALDAFEAAVVHCVAHVLDRCGIARLEATCEATAGRLEMHVRLSGRMSETRPRSDVPTIAFEDSVPESMQLLLDAGAADQCRIRQETPDDIAIEFESTLPTHPHRPREVEPIRTPSAARDEADTTSLAAARRAHEALLHGLKEAREEREELHRLRQELEETNRGVVALYAELDERADELRRADQAKSRFLSNVSHELRTPLNSIRALSGLLLDRLDGPLTGEQEKQVQFIRRAAEDLRQLVDDLLDLAKIAAGKTEVRAETFAVDELFGALRGMLKPLRANATVALEFEAPADLPAMCSDEAKLSQILRNLVSNALKFTEQGEVRVRAQASADGSTMRFEVVDTGIGIAAEDRERIFEEFVQVAHPLQARAKGTGLGLPLCRRLAALLGGSIHVDGESGRGSRFTVVLPRVYAAADKDAPSGRAPIESSRDAEGAADPTPPCEPELSPGAAPLAVLIVDDDPAARYALRRRLEDAGATVAEAGDGSEGLTAARSQPPDLVLLDLHLPDMSGEDVLLRLRAAAATRTLPVVIVTSAVPDAVQAAFLGTQDAAIVPKRDIARDDFCRRLLAHAKPNPASTT